MLKCTSTYICTFINIDYSVPENKTQQMYLAVRTDVYQNPRDNEKCRPIATLCLINNHNNEVVLSTFGRDLNVFTYNVKVKFSLEQAMKAQRGNRVIALLFLQPRQ
jgi:hypothetical protein